mmetsp:Transcript_37394/g.79475  ORF Transcript_37394/g.79475 Transcript_37394/m.79475 type:complete len:94 (+) Transcript_37394:600-881(+)
MESFMVTELPAYKNQPLHCLWTLVASLDDSFQIPNGPVLTCRNDQMLAICEVELDLDGSFWTQMDLPQSLQSNKHPKVVKQVLQTNTYFKHEN